MRTKRGEWSRKHTMKGRALCRASWSGLCHQLVLYPSRVLLFPLLILIEMSKSIDNWVSPFSVSKGRVPSQFIHKLIGGITMGRHSTKFWKRCLRIISCKIPLFTEWPSGVVPGAYFTVNVCYFHVYKWQTLE